MGSIPEIEKAAIFGSRALGNYKTGSDVDLAVYGDSLSRSSLRMLQDQLNEKLPLPYMFDIVRYEEIESPKLKEHIDQYGKVIHSKGVGE